jgi:hypothetical protein
MANYTPYTRDLILNWLKGTALPAVTDRHAAFFDGSTEVTEDIRPAGRLGISFNAPTNSATGRKIVQTADIDYGAADTATDVSAVIVMESDLSSNQLFSLPRNGGTKTFAQGAVVKIKNAEFDTVGDFENAIKDNILNWLRGNSAPSAPAGLFVALTDAAGDEITTSVRTAGRVALTLGTVSGGEVANSSEVDFGESVSAVTVFGFRVFSAQSAGNAITKNITFASPKVIGIGDEVAFGVGELEISID